MKIELEYDQMINISVYLLIKRSILIGHESTDHSKQNVFHHQFRNLQLYKQKILAARKGHELLKRKADALKKKFKEIMKSLLESKKNMG